MNSLRSEFIIYNEFIQSNLIRYLAKRKVPVSREYIIKPFMIDNNLSEKKKQPKFVVERKYNFDDVKWAESLPADLNFMETCRCSIYIRTVRSYSLLSAFLQSKSALDSKPLLNTNHVRPECF